MSTRVIISAAGSRGVLRWNNHLGRPKHLIQIPPGGETLLRRTTRIVRELGVDDVVIAAPVKDPKGHTYETEGARIFRKEMPKREKKVFYKQADRYLPRELWNTEGRTLFLPGDFYFTRKSLEGIIDYDPGTWVFYARVRTTTWPADGPSVPSPCSFPCSRRIEATLPRAFRLSAVGSRDGPRIVFLTGGDPRDNSWDTGVVCSTLTARRAIVTLLRHR
jgi:hypothetical protein